MSNDAIAVILGSAFSNEDLGLELEEHVVETRHGNATLYRTKREDRPAYLLFRHGLPHTLLPNQINYRANAAALRQVGCKSLLVTSSVGVMDSELPMGVPMAIADILTMDNRLPDGAACTMFGQPSAEHGHLVLQDGLVSSELSAQIDKLANTPLPRVVFAYVGGPRTKSPAENRMWRSLGAQVNSMSVAPEIILANELEISCAGLLVGHKPSPGTESRPDAEAIARSLDESRAAQRSIITAFLQNGSPVPFANLIYRFHRE